MHRLKIDPWSADYGPSLETDISDIESQVKLDIEGGPWEARRGQPETLPRRLGLVDGVRRIELHLRLEDAQQSRTAALGAVAAAGIVIEQDRPQGLSEALQQLEIQSLLVVDGEDAPEVPGVIALCGHSDPMLALQNRMRALESQVASRLAAEVDLVICDGPLQNVHSLQHEVLGYVKSQHRQLLPLDRMELVRNLQAGERTPLFALGTSSYDRFSWYLRLETPAYGESVLAGIVRLEVQSSAGLERARVRADQSCQLLPRLRNPRFRDPRSPQNLIPIAVLEKALRHRLGDPNLRQRHFRRLLLGGRP